jgi:WD40 repeat protein
LTAGGISPDGTCVALADSHQTRIFSIEYEPIRITLLRTIEVGAYVLQFGVDGQLLLGGFDGSVHVIDLATWKKQSYKPHNKTVIRLGVSSCGTYIVSGDSSKKIVCYNTTESKVEFIHVDSWHTTHILFSPHPFCVPSNGSYCDDYHIYQRCIPNRFEQSELYCMVQ